MNAIFNYENNDYEHFHPISIIEDVKLQCKPSIYGIESGIKSEWSLDVIEYVTFQLK